MKPLYLVITAIVVVAILGYVGRHQIKAMLNGTPTTAPMQTAAPTSPSPTQASASSSATTNSIVMTKTDATKGSFLTDPKGMTLYMFDKDKPGVSNCTGGCLKVWPPYSPAKGTSNALPAHITIITSPSGAAQYAYNDMPLYYYASDTKAGDTLGDGVNNVWHLVKP